jgi:phosphate transport system substrate-binding protein
MIQVRRTAEHASFEVVVPQGKGQSRHHVTMSPEMCERLTAGRSKLAYVSLQNRDGEFTTPSRQAFRSALANANWAAAPAFYASLAHQPGKQTWPITGATFVLIYKQQQKRLTAIEMLRFFDPSYRARR